MIKAYYVLRKDLNMSPAKLAVQCGHGTQLLMLSENYKILEDWKLNSDSRKVVCEISSEEKAQDRIITICYLEPLLSQGCVSASLSQGCASASETLLLT